MVLLVVALLTRPPFPVDETRYLSVAWEMWSRGDLLVPHLLGEPYAHKPPLLFWCMHLGWWLFGVSEWWARSVPFLFAVATVALSVRTARVLWPDLQEVARLTPWLLVGALFWSLFATLTMFDLLMAACTMLAALGLVLAAVRRQRIGYVLAGCGIGLGILAKGPVVLVHVVPLMVLAPWWAALPRERWWRWSAGCAAGLALGAAIGLAWALPAARHGGDAYADAILWHQSTARITADDTAKLNPHSHSWWWYLPFLPALLFPWAIWPPVWRAMQNLRALMSDFGVRWALSWCVPVVVLHSAISGKQVHYLIPLVAPAMLLGARLLCTTTPHATPSRRDQWPVQVVLGVIALVLLIAPYLDQTTIRQLSMGNNEAAPEAWTSTFGLLPGLTVVGLMVLLPFLHGPTMLRAVRALTLTGLSLLISLHLILAELIGPAYDLRPLSRRIAAWQQAGVPVARVGGYRAEYQFLGRLTAPPDVIRVEEIPTWAAQHPSGVFLMTFSARRPLPAGMVAPSEDMPHRGVRLGLWYAAQLLPPTATPTKTP
jgi:4-amino-4-deoxy-L-arabinose transferase-like glycosyltransferase